MRTLKSTAVALTLLILAGCESVPPPPPPPTNGSAGFDRRDFAWSTERGRGRIDGQLILRRGSTTYSCEAAGVVLTPETPWVRERMQRLYRSTDRAVALVADVRQRMPDESPNYDAFVRKSACDGQNRFSFGGLPDGVWYLITSGQPTPAGAQLAIMRKVVIRNGATVKVEL